MKLAVGAVLEKDGKFLLVQEAEPHKKGKWNFPCGGLEEFENIYQGLKREVREETGYVIDPLELVQIYRYKSLSGKDVLMFLFKAEIIGGDGNIQATEEILQHDWFTDEEIQEKNDLVGFQVKDGIQALQAGEMRTLIVDTFEEDKNAE